MVDGQTDDEALLGALRRIAAAADPVPGPVLEAARGSFTWRTIDAELAELAYDSALDRGQTALVRSTGARRVLTFESADVSVTVEVSTTADERRLVGQLAPAQPAEIEVRHAGGVVAVTADELGRFAAGGVAPGPISLLCRVRGRPVATGWLVV